MRPTAPQILEQNSHEARENASCFEQRLFSLLLFSIRAGISTIEIAFACFSIPHCYLPEVEQ